jgi:hypothetical protein
MNYFVSIFNLREPFYGYFSMAWVYSLCNVVAPVVTKGMRTTGIYVTVARTVKTLWNVLDGIFTVT